MRNVTIAKRNTLIINDISKNEYYSTWDTLLFDLFLTIFA